MTDRKPAQHSDTVAFYIDRARAAIRKASEQHRQADPPPRPEPERSTAGTERVAPVRAAIAEANESTEEST